MAPLLELQRDKSFRLRLILACFGVAFLVSFIYVIVSYQIAKDLGIQSELNSLQRQAMLLHTELTEDHHDPEEHLSELVELTYLESHVNVDKLYVEANGEGFVWSFTHDMTIEHATVIKNKLITTTVSSENTTNDNGTKELDGVLFLWQVVEGQGYRIVIIEVARSIDAALSLVAKRLSITSILIFCMSAWLAILLSSWMNRRVQSKNDALTRLATYDSLTGLPNKLYLIDTMQKIMPETSTPNTSELDAIRSPKEVSGCLFVIDLDKFKEVNDAFGHSAGDHLLKKVSSRLISTLNDDYVIARIGGDEFIVWAENLELKGAISLAKELVSVCNQPVMINKLAVNTGGSVGIAHYPTQATDIESLILSADIAMYEAKQKHTGWGIFNARDANKNRQKLQLRADLGEALSQHQIHLYFQPKVRLKSGKIIAVEALSRWNHPTDGLLYPISFIDLIEQSGRVQEFGRYVASKAIYQLAEWQKQGIYTPIAINLSPYNLLDLGLLNFMLALLDKLNVSPNMLEVELIESFSNLDIEHIANRLNKFREAGIRLAIDDFGTGMSSLSYINKLNVNLIKIDRSFINDMEQDINKQAIVSTAITLAKSFGTKLLAEGIENKAQADQLMQMGCRYGQGYYYGKAISADTMMKLLQSKATLPIQTDTPE